MAGFKAIHLAPLLRPTGAVIPERQVCRFRMSASSKHRSRWACLYELSPAAVFAKRRGCFRTDLLFAHYITFRIFLSPYST
jgi:hypothetical protein